MWQIQLHRFLRLVCEREFRVKLFTGATSISVGPVGGVTRSRKNPALGGVVGATRCRGLGHAVNGVTGCTKRGITQSIAY